MAETKLKNQSLDTTTRLTSKIITATRAFNGNAGDVSYTGVGFTPTSITVLFNIDGTVWEGHGIVDSNKTSAVTWFNWNNLYYHSTNFVHLEHTDANYPAQTAILKSYDTDGFTLTWSKRATPPALTINLMFICYR